jgi:hypothetical protein
MSWLIQVKAVDWSAVADNHMARHLAASGSALEWSSGEAASLLCSHNVDGAKGA